MSDTKTVLITGASRGIGKAIALAFAKRGDSLIITNSRSKEEIRAVAEECKALGSPFVHTFTGDLGDPVQADRLFWEMAVTIGSINILVNNAGISMIKQLQDTTDEDWMKMVNTNLSSAFYMSRNFSKNLIKQKDGVILNISSVWGEYGASCEVAYSATKGGLNGLTKALAKELAPSGIRVNALALGCIDTTMNAHLSDAERKALEDEIPMGRYGTPEEAADAVLRICDMPKYMTGQIITMDGGWM